MNIKVKPLVFKKYPSGQIAAVTKLRTDYWVSGVMMAPYEGMYQWSFSDYSATPAHGIVPNQAEGIAACQAHYREMVLSLLEGEGA